MIVEKNYVMAQAELSRAAELAEGTGRVRLQLDTQVALARLYSAQHKSDAAQLHLNTAKMIAEAISNSLQSTGLEARIPFENIDVR
jgi:hypothetical protein